MSSPPSENVAESVSLSRRFLTGGLPPLGPSAVRPFIHACLRVRLDELTESQRERKMEGSTLPLPSPLSRIPF